MGDSKKKSKQQTIKLSHLTPEEILARAFRAKCRFKALVKFVIANIYWLSDIEDEELGDDVQKNVILLTKKKGKKGLTLRDKALLNKPAGLRTEEEKQHLEHSIGDLKCFRRYPRDVKAKLPGMTYFFYFGPGRTLLRQGHPSYGLYFVVSGEVTVYQTSYDPIFEEDVTVPVAVKGPGSMFGEVALLRGIPRTATIISNTDVEILCLKKEDFDSVLKDTVQKQWDDIQAALRGFTYFESWDEISIRECCMLSKLNKYVTHETILGDGKGLADYVYFILKGRCQIIEHLQVIPHIKSGQKYYKLYSPPPAPSLKSLKSQSVNTTTSPTTDTDQERKKGSMNKYKTSSSSVPTTLSRSVSKYSKKSKNQFISESSIAVTPKISQRYAQLSILNLPWNVETHFMQVCLLYPTACFGIGENLKNKRIIAVMETQCLLVPRCLLLKQNNGHIWNKVQRCLSSLIPSTNEVFQEFIKQRKWDEYRSKLAITHFKRNFTKVNTMENVPYFIRIHQQIDRF